MGLKNGEDERNRIQKYVPIRLVSNCPTGKWSLKSAANLTFETGFDSIFLSKSMTEKDSKILCFLLEESRGFLNVSTETKRSIYE